MLRVDECPCGQSFTTETQQMVRTRRHEDGVRETEEWTWTVTCAAGHSFPVEYLTNVSPRWVLRDAVDSA